MADIRDRGASRAEEKKLVEALRKFDELCIDPICLAQTATQRVSLLCLAPPPPHLVLL